LLWLLRLRGSDRRTHRGEAGRGKLPMNDGRDRIDALLVELEAVEALGQVERRDAILRELQGLYERRGQQDEGEEGRNPEP